MQQKRYSSDPTERQWQRIAPLFVVQCTSKWPLRTMVNGICYVLQNGCVWRDVPADLPPWVTVYQVEHRWDLGVGERLPEYRGPRVGKKTRSPAPSFSTVKV